MRKLKGKIISIGKLEGVNLKRGSRGNDEIILKKSGGFW